MSKESERVDQLLGSLSPQEQKKIKDAVIAEFQAGKSDAEKATKEEIDEVIKNLKV